MKLSINKKIMFGFGLIILLMIIANAYVLMQLLAISDTAKITLTSEVSAIDIAKSLQKMLYSEERNAEKYRISGDRTYYEMFAQGRTSLGKSVDSLITMESDSARRVVALKIRRIHQWYASRIGPEEKTKNRSVKPQGSDSLDALHAAISEFISLNQRSIDEAMTTVETITTRSSGISVILAVCTLLGAVALAFFIPRMITKPINVLIRGTEQITRGTFEPIKVTSRDEIAQLTEAVNEMSDKLKKTDEYKSELMHHIAHELRTPFQIVLSVLYRLNRQDAGPLTEEQSELLRTIRKSINAANNYTNQLLDIAKIEAGMMEYNLKPIDLLSVIQPVIDNAKIIAGQKDISVQLEAGQIPMISADEEKIYTIMNNLLNNAVKYTEGGGVIKIAVSAGQNRVKIIVEDSGIGIAEEELPKIFNKFYQAKNASQASAKGTGIGLALVKAYTEGHGGKVSVRSTPGKGTAFCVELPNIFENSKNGI